MIEEIKAHYCIAGCGIAGIILASKLAATGEKIIIIDQERPTQKKIVQKC